MIETILEVGPASPASADRVIKHSSAGHGSYSRAMARRPAVHRPQSKRPGRAIPTSSRHGRRLPAHGALRGVHVAPTHSSYI